MAQKMSLGDTDQGLATAGLAANVAVKWHTVAGSIVVCGVGDIPIGITQEAIPIGKTGTFWRWGRGNRFYCVATGVAAGDLVKQGAAGIFVPEATVTTVTAVTIGQARTATDSAGNAEITGTR
jgi:hypothetical protein